MVRIDFFRADTVALLDALARYQGTMEAQLEQAKVIARQQQEKLGDISDLEEWRYALQEADDIYQYTYEFAFPRFLHYSFVVLLFLAFENRVLRSCDVLAKRRNIPIKVNDLKGEAVARSKRYLRDVVGLSGPSDSQWEPIEDLSKIRNCIVHTLGEVDRSPDQRRLKQLAKCGQGLKLSGPAFGEPGWLEVTQEYCQQAVEDVQKFFDALHDAAGFFHDVPA